jgi:serine-type D-Ala-D-Ala carboxypeptidase/endopeptidase (penicillin-binding protein 4)
MTCPTPFVAPLKALRLMWFGCVLWCLPTFASADALTDLKRLQAERGARISALVFDLDNDEVLTSLNARKRVSPASLTKLVLASAALETWSGDHQFSTQVQGTPPDATGVISGDLWISGEGDPSFEHRDLWLLAARLKQAGVRLIDGDIVASYAPFGMLPCETKDRCDAAQGSHTAYDAPLSALGVDYGTWCIDVLPQQPGHAATLAHCAAIDVPIPLQGAVASRASDRPNGLWLDRRSIGGEDRLVMGGEISREARLYRSMGDPALGTAQLLRQALNELGVGVTGSVHASESAAPEHLVPLARHEGTPLRHQVTSLLRYSNNYISDMLTLGLALQRTPEPVTSLAGASQILVDRIYRARRAVGLPEDRVDQQPVVLLSGSGLTPENRVSAEDLVALLRDEYRNTRRFPLFYAGLVVPGEAPSRSLRRGGDAWRERVMLKTGTLSEPTTVFGTAGYLRKRDGGWMAFAVMVNGAPRKGIPMAVSLQAIRRDIERLLAAH